MLRTRFMSFALCGLGAMAFFPLSADAQIRRTLNGAGPAARPGAGPVVRGPVGPAMGNPRVGTSYGGRAYYGAAYPGFYDSFWFGYGSPRYYNYGYPYQPNFFEYPPSYSIDPPTYLAPPPAVYMHVVPRQPGVPQAPPQLQPLPATPLEPDAPQDKTAIIELTVPRADAKVWVDDNLMKSGSGNERSFTSPPLEPGSYAYRIRATWLDDGQEVRVEREVTVTPGRITRLDLSKSK
jgi:uncharacterized protein (TIGR03000 family)